MPEPRKLTPDEKKRVHQWALTMEQEKYPDAHIVITVEDDMDAEGRVHYQTMAMTEKVVPRWEL